MNRMIFFKIKTNDEFYRYKSLAIFSMKEGTAQKEMNAIKC